jgi:hypothetical protein
MSLLCRDIFKEKTLWPSSLPAALGLGVYSASNRNEYQKQNNVSGEYSAVGV